ncbi:hypothetical protein [Cellvibrio sp. PSBB023]|uniref:hypothetical protein n=1 Tax=Cellvibrio sp. PSBB023 TaxID=1945512 RepID=UPI001438AECC|nr:hypothetical protein [Cellvibrio sp. PSBB023]
MAQLFQSLLQLFEQLNQLSPSASALVALALIFGVVAGMALIFGILVISKNKA